MDNDWLKGRLGNDEGMFLAEFVNIIEDLRPKSKTTGMCVYNVVGCVGE